MTTLQQLAFERLTNINKEVCALLPNRWPPGASELIISMAKFKQIQTLMFEQQNWLEALWEEEQKDGNEEII